MKGWFERSADLHPRSVEPADACYAEKKGPSDGCQVLTFATGGFQT